MGAYGPSRRKPVRRATTSRGLAATSRPERVDQDVGAGEERAQHGEAARRLEVQRDGAFAPREGVVGRGCRVPDGLRPVDAEDGGAVVGKEEAGEGAWPALGLMSAGGRTV
jgi:hypothetical protein